MLVCLRSKLVHIKICVSRVISPNPIDEFQVLYSFVVLYFRNTLYFITLKMFNRYNRNVVYELIPGRSILSYKGSQNTVSTALIQ